MNIWVKYRVYTMMNPSSLLQKQVGEHGFSREIHPAYRGALAKGISDNWETIVDDIEVIGDATK